MKKGWVLKKEKKPSKAYIHIQSQAAFKELQSEATVMQQERQMSPIKAHLTSLYLGEV